MVAYSGEPRKRFQEALERAGVPFANRPHFARWVQTWLRETDSDLARQSSPQEFSDRLASKGAPEWQCRQAFQAVLLWQKMATEPLPVVQVPSTEWSPVLEAMARNLQSKQYSPRTIEAYLDWARRLAKFAPAVPQDGKAASQAVQAYLKHLVLAKNLSRSSVAQARNAFAWLVRRELGFELELEVKGSAHHGRRIPTILSPEMVRDVLDQAPPPWDLLFALQYGCGLRLAELLELRVQDLDMRRGVVRVHSGKGDKDRQVPLPKALYERIERHLHERETLWRGDLARGWAKVDLPGAMVRVHPEAETAWEWQHVFGARQPLRHPGTNELRRWHPMETLVRNALREAARKAGVTERVHPHLLRHCYATHLVEAGVPLNEVQEMLGHNRLETTMIYLHVRSPVPQRISPLDRMPAFRERVEAVGPSAASLGPSRGRGISRVAARP